MSLNISSPVAGGGSAPIRNLNRFTKVKLYVIALGELNVDIDSLRQLAAAGDGETIWVREQ